jgi:uncharacterized protein (DUF302 family)
MSVVTKPVPGTTAEAVARLLALLKAKNVTVFAVIDQAAAAREAGLRLRDTVLVMFGDPAVGTLVMDAAPTAALDLPLKVVIWDDSGQTVVGYRDPIALAVGQGASQELAAKLGAVNVLTDALAAGS